MRAVIYARYSSENQSAASIDDQIRLCKERIAAEGWQLVQVLRDAAISGASALRPGYQALLEGAREAAFDVVVAEALDRLSRDQEDVAALFKRLRFAGIRIVALAEGEISELHVGLKGTMNALFLKDLAAKTHRGLRGRVAAGKSAGGRAFGYDVVRQLDAAGNPVRGERAIDAAEAAVVRRIFAMFAAGDSPLGIAKMLNAEKVPGPDGRPWRDTTIRGHALRGTGILRNELYVGRMVWNRMRFIKDPATGRRVSRMNPRGQWIGEEVPELLIIDQGLWDRAQARLAGIRARSGADVPDRQRFWEKRRAQTVLTGKVFCACCGGTLAAVGRDYLACGTARRQGLCSNRGGIRRGQLEGLILEALRTRLMAPDLVADFIREFTAEWNRLAAERSSARATKERELASVTRKLDGLIDAMADGFRAPRLQAQLDKLETRRSTLETELKAPAASAPPRLHPNLAEIYRDRVAKLHDALQSPDGGRAALEAVRELIERIEVRPATDGTGLEIELIGAIAAMVWLGQGDDAADRRVAAGDRGLFECSVKVVAGTRNHLDLLLSG
jgi:DNA invertase Pin-like site-specific DNA recombinase